MADDETLLVLNEIAERIHSGAGKDCSDDERRLHAAYIFIMNLEMNGLSGYLYNISDDWEQLLHVKCVMESLAQNQLSDAIEEIHKIVRAGPKDYVGTWEEWMNITDPNDRLDTLAERLSGSYDIIDRHLEERLNMRYTLQQFRW